MKILAIDPGERVGWAHGIIYGPGTNTAYPVADEVTLKVTGHGITPLKAFALKLGEVFETYDVVVYERWVLARGMAEKLAGSEMQTSQLIGMIRYLGWQHPNVQLVGQYPAEMKTARKTLPTDIRAIIDNLPGAHDDSHDESALLHLWRYFWKRYV